MWPATSRSAACRHRWRLIATRRRGWESCRKTIDDTLYDAFGQRQVSTIFTQLNQYHVVLEVDPTFQQNPDALKQIYVHSSNGTQVPLSAFTQYSSEMTPIAVNHQGQFPVVTLSFNLAQGVSLGQAVDAIKQAQQDIGLPASIHAGFQGTAQAFQASLANEPILVLAALVTVYIVLGVLYESYIHPDHDSFDAALGGRRRAAGLADHAHRFQRHCAHRNHPADRNRAEERDHDDRLCARSGTQGRQEARSTRFIRRACCDSGPF